MGGGDVLLALSMSGLCLFMSVGGNIDISQLSGLQEVHDSKKKKNPDCTDVQSVLGKVIKNKKKQSCV